VSLLEAVGAALVYVLVGLVSGGAASVRIPLLGDLQELFPGMDASRLQLWFAAGVVVLRSSMVLLRTYVEERLINNAGVLVADDLLRGYLAMPYLLHTQRNSAELVRNTYDGTQQMVVQALRPAVQLAVHSVVSAGLVLVLLVASPVPTLLAAGLLIPTVWLLQSRVQPRLKELGRRAQHARTGAITSVQQSLGAIRDIQLLERGTEFAAGHVTERLRLARSQYLAHVLQKLPRLMIETSLVLTIVAVFAVGLLQGADMEDVLPTLGLFAYAGLRLQPVLQDLIGALNRLRYSSAVLEDLVADRRRMEQWRRDVGAAADTATRATGPEDPGFAGEITFSQVGFSYDPSGAPVLREVDLMISPGEFVGICGPSGGGKSTLVDLLIGLLQPTQGVVSVDGRALDARPVWWWRQLGVVPQQVLLIDDSLRANIAFGEASGAIDESRMRECVEVAQLSATVAELPQGLDTIVGERGVRLSGGQRQRVAIARALYQDPPVLVLDEGTSALDGATEAELVSAIDRARRSRTLIAVAHRLSTLTSADRILVFVDGRIADQGSYAELMERTSIVRALA